MKKQWIIFDKIKISTFKVYLKTTKQEYGERYYFNYVVESYEEPKDMVDWERKDTWISILTKGGNITKKFGMKRKLCFHSNIKLFIHIILFISMFSFLHFHRLSDSNLTSVFKFPKKKKTLITIASNASDPIS
jgi:hypothetical protein